MGIGPSVTDRSLVLTTICLSMIHNKIAASIPSDNGKGLDFLVCEVSKGLKSLESNTHVMLFGAKQIQLC